MLMVEASIAKSSVHGLGLFAVKPILKDRVLWSFSDPDHMVPLAVATDSQLHYGYVNRRRPTMLVVCGDEARYWNFAANGTMPNAVEGYIDASGEAIIVAARDIATGEELLISMISDADADRKLS